jgi:hypothetical protein
VQVKVQMSGQVKLNCSKGSGELSGENPAELSAQHLDLEMTTKGRLLQRRLEAQRLMVRAWVLPAVDVTMATEYQEVSVGFSWR